MTAPSTIWTKNGALIVDAAGRPIVCDVCPCPDDCETLLARLDALALQYQGVRYGEGALIQRREAGDTTTVAQEAFLYNTGVQDRIALVTCGEGDECRWADLEYNLATDSYLLMPGLCRCPTMLPFYLQAVAIGAEILPEGVYCSRRNATPEDTAYGFSSATPYLAAYFNGSAWRVLRCNCAVLTLSGYDSYAFYPYPGACECFDLRRLIVEHAPSLGVIDWRFGPDWIISNGTSFYRVSTSNYYRDTNAFSFIEDDGKGYQRFICIGENLTPSSKWAAVQFSYIEEAPLWVEYSAHPELSVYGQVEGAAFLCHWSWNFTEDYDTALHIYNSSPNNNGLYATEYSIDLNPPRTLKWVTELGPIKPGDREAPQIVNDRYIKGRWEAKGDQYEYDYIVGMLKSYYFIYLHQWICTPDGPLIRGGWNKIYSSAEVAAAYGYDKIYREAFVGVYEVAWSAETDCPDIPSPDCPGDDGSWKAEVP